MGCQCWNSPQCLNISPQSTWCDCHPGMWTPRMIPSSSGTRSSPRDANWKWFPSVLRWAPDDQEPVFFQADLMGFHETCQWLHGLWMAYIIIYSLWMSLVISSNFAVFWVMEDLWKVSGRSRKIQSLGSLMFTTPAGCWWLEHVYIYI